ncbi:hypothetical protein TRIP_C60019 [Candidatus Zixiibacteriota bacterium]|nr:hypothetical protein TRIP_C60019 [candidate division Zixibacteria bacterium]
MGGQNKNQIPNQIRRYRRKKHLRLRQVAYLAGLTGRSHISYWENGKKIPTLVNALKLSAIIQCPIEILFSGLFNSVRHEVFLKQQALLEKEDAK